MPFTLTGRGSDDRGVNTNSLVIPSFTSAADEAIFLIVAIGTSGGANKIPDSITGHDSSTSWAQLGTSVITPGADQCCFSLWAARSSGVSESVTIAYSTATIMSAACASATGIEPAGDITNIYDLIDSDVQYVGGGNSLTLDLTGASNASIHFWGTKFVPTLTVENTQIAISDIPTYNRHRCYIDYKDPGDTTPSASPATNAYVAGFALELRQGGLLTLVDVNSGNPIRDGAAGVVISGANMSGVNSVKLKNTSLSIEVAQTNLSAGASQVTFDVAIGNLPYGSIDVEISDGVTTLTTPAQLLPATINGYVIAASAGGINDITSLAYGASGPVPDGSIVEYNKLSSTGNIVTVQTNLSYSIASIDSSETFQVRVWNSSTEIRGSWVTKTVTSADVASANLTASNATMVADGDVAEVATADLIMSNAALSAAGVVSGGAVAGIGNLISRSASMSVDSGTIEKVYAPSWEILTANGVTKSAKIYDGRDNYIMFKLYNNGIAYEDLINTSSALFRLHYNNSYTSIDSSLYSSKFDWSLGDGKLLFNADSINVVDGRIYEGELIIYNYSHDDGVVFVDRSEFKIIGVNSETLAEMPYNRIVDINDGYNYFSQDAVADLDYWMPWSEDLGNDSILSVAVSVPAGITAGASGKNTNYMIDADGRKYPSSSAAYVWLSGGTPGIEYTITVRITTAAGRTDERSFTVAVTQL